MAERIAAPSKKPEVKQTCSNSFQQNPSYSSSGSPADRILQLQRTAGNQAVQRLIKSGALQTKLRIGQPNDVYEQEADRVAEQVMRMPEPQVSNEMKISKKTAANPIQRKCPGCKLKDDKEEKILQAKENSGSTPEVSSELESSISEVRGGGQPLPESTRAFFEPRFGHNFRGVRVHTDSQAAETAKSINATAFTLGPKIVFSEGKYSPKSQEGKKLLAHELTHVIQQGYSFNGIEKTHPVVRPKLFAVVQRQPDNKIQSANDEPAFTTELNNEIKKWEPGANQNSDLMLRAYASRMMLLLGYWSRQYSLRTREDLDRFIDDCEEKAKTELDTLNVFPEGAELALATSTKGFPLTWSGRVQAALTLGYDPVEIFNDWKKVNSDMVAQSKSLGSEIFLHGLPVPFNNLGRLENFKLRISDAKLEKESAVRDYARKSIFYMQLKFISVFAFYWEKTVNDIAEAVADGKVVPSFHDWKDFINNKQAILRDLPIRARDRLVESEEEAQKFQNEAIQLKDVALLAGMMSSLASISGILSAWKEVTSFFDNSLQNADKSVATSEDSRVLKALKWAWDNDYYSGAAVAQVQNLIEHGPEILKEIAIILILGMIPGVNIAVAVWLLFTTARDVIGMIGELVSALLDVKDSKNVASLQKAASRLSQILVNGAITILIVLATYGVGKAAARLRKRAAELRATDKTLTAEGAEKKAFEEMSTAERKPLEQAAQKVEQFEHRYNSDTKPILDTPGVREKLTSISEDARSLIELCQSPCLPPAHQLLDADLKLLETIQKRLGRLGYDRGLKDYFYRRRFEEGGLKKAIKDLDGVKKEDLQKFLDADRQKAIEETERLFPKKFANNVKGDAGRIHGVDQYRKGQVILTAKLRLPSGDIEKVAVPNTGAGWRPLQREKAIELGYKPLEPQVSGSDLHAEPNLYLYIKYKNATVLEWAISRGVNGNSIVCSDCWNNYAKYWPDRIK